MFSDFRQVWDAWGTQTKMSLTPLLWRLSCTTSFQLYYFIPASADGHVLTDQSNGADSELHVHMVLITPWQEPFKKRYLTASHKCASVKF